IQRQDCDEDKLMELVLEAGADDMTVEEDVFGIVMAPSRFEGIKTVLDKNRIPMASAEITTIPKTTIKVEGKQAEQILKLMEALDELDDVQHVYSNFDIDENELEG
ncbi:MAG TPA: YebC/PmpR family DNA-binding transcriptional regulator, partial [bacterium]